MILVKDSLAIRNALPSDADILNTWWNDGKIMAHAGFPNGVGGTVDKVRKSLSSDHHIIELDGNPIGEMSYSSEDGKVASIGIKICDQTQQNRGFGTTLLSMFIDALFVYYGFNKIVLDTNANNKHAQHVYEKKLGMTNVAVHENSWTDQVGVLQSSIDYEITKDAWQKRECFTSSQGLSQSYIHLRTEKQADQYTVESITRDAFWPSQRKRGDGNTQICDEHLLVYRLRTTKALVPELNIVAEIGGHIVGHIIYSRSNVIDTAGSKHEILTFGPLTVSPPYQRIGVGQALMLQSFKVARELGYRGIVIFGHPEYYPGVGFRRAAEFDITDTNGEKHDYIMAYPLYDGALDDICGCIHVGAVYDNLTPEDALMFDKKFPRKLLEEEFNTIQKRAQTYNFSSMNYIQFDECNIANILRNDSDIIILQNGKMLYFATDDFSLVLEEIVKINSPLRLHFVPREHVPALKKLGFSEWAEFVDIFNMNLPYSASQLTDTAPLEYMQLNDCLMVYNISRRCKLQSRGFEGAALGNVEKWLREYRVIVQRHRGDIIGFCCVNIYDMGTGITLHIVEIAVDPAYQGMGYGRKLMEQAITHGVQNGATKGFLLADVQNKNALRLYEKYNFRSTNSDYELQMIR